MFLNPEVWSPNFQTPRTSRPGECREQLSLKRTLEKFEFALVVSRTLSNSPIETESLNELPMVLLRADLAILWNCTNSLDPNVFGSEPNAMKSILWSSYGES